MSYQKFKFFILSIFIILFAGCTSSKQAKNMFIENNVVEKDEQRLMNRMKKLSSIIDYHESTIHNKKVNSYPNEILAKLIANDKLHKDEITNFKIKVIKNPLLNAFALADGNIYIHSGLLAKLENEAQLALLIGHEMSHVIYKHGIKKSRHYKNSTFIADLARNFDLGIFSSFIYASAVSGYSRGSENEADLEGLNQIVDAGYDPKEAVKLFEIMLEDIKLNEIKESYFFSTHPKVVDRIESSEKIINEKYSDTTGLVDKKRFQRYIKPMLIENIEMDLKLKRFKSAKKSIDTFMNRYEENAYGNYLLAEYHRLNEFNFDDALKNYNIALQKETDNYNSYRGLGYLYMKKKEKDKARIAFEQYLSFNENASDKKYIERYIRTLKNNKENHVKTNIKTK